MTPPTLATVLEEIRLDLNTMPELRRCYFEVPDAVNERPAIVVVPSTGRWRFGPHSSDQGYTERFGIHRIAVVLLVPRQDLAKDFDLCVAFTDKVGDWLWAGFERDAYGGSTVMLGDPDLVNNATAPMEYTIGGSVWGSDQDLALTYEFDVTILTETRV